MNGSAVSRGRRVLCLLSAGGAGFGVCCQQGAPGSVSGFSVPRKFVIKKIRRIMNRLDDDAEMGHEGRRGADEGGDADDDEEDSDDESVVIIAVVTDDEHVTDDELEGGYWSEELLSDVEGCDHGPNCRHVWCEAWQEECETEEDAFLADRDDYLALFRKRLEFLLDLSLEEREERRAGDGRWTEEERLNFVWLRRKRRIEFFARAEVKLLRDGWTWPEGSLSEFYLILSYRELEVLDAERERYRERYNNGQR